MSLSIKILERVRSEPDKWFGANEFLDIGKPAEIMAAMVDLYKGGSVQCLGEPKRESMTPKSEIVALKGIKAL